MNARSLRVLILGGTRVIGPHFVRAALARGHQVAVFNRGTISADLPEEVESLIGDRNGDLEAIKNRDWDAVLDMATYGPRWVRSLGEALAGRVGHYTFISTINVYGMPPGGRAIAEGESVLEYRGSADPYGEAATASPTESFEYGALKVLCEQEAERQFPGKTLVLRPGYMTGPGDPHQALVYWPTRMAKGGEAMAAGDPAQPVQFIDMRDVAEWAIRMVERQATGVYNTVGPAGTLDLGGLMAAGDVDASQLTWVPLSWLADRGDAELWSKLLFWSSEFGSFAGLVDNQRALADGLAIRPLAETLADSLAWCERQPESFGLVSAPWPVYLQREREALAAWHAQSAEAGGG